MCPPLCWNLLATGPRVQPWWPHGVRAVFFPSGTISFPSSVGSSCCLSSSQNQNWHIVTVPAQTSRLFPPKTGANPRDVALWGPASLSPSLGCVIPERPCCFTPNILESRAGVSHACGSDSTHRNPCRLLACLFLPSWGPGGSSRQISLFNIQALLWAAKMHRAFIFKCTSIKPRLTVQ